MRPQRVRAGPLRPRDGERQRRGNVGRYSVHDGFQVQELAPGWGRGNVLIGNSGRLGDAGAGADAAGVLIALDPVADNVVRCDNRLLGGVGDLSNVECE